MITTATHPRVARRLCAIFLLMSLGLTARPVLAQTGVPPDDAKALVEAPKAPGSAPKIDTIDGSNLTLSVGGQVARGNSSLVAVTANGAFETRFMDNGIGAYVLGNYGQSNLAKEPMEETAENIQGRVRYDRYLLDNLSLFVLNTGRHDKLQGLAFRYNLDPGVRFLFFTAATNALWVEAGYDFQYQILLADARKETDAAGAPVLNAAGMQQLLPPTERDHSARLFVGFRHGFSKEVTLSTGLEYLQSFEDGHRYRFNGDALMAAKVGYGLAFGVSTSLRYDHAPLPGKNPWDWTLTASLIYAISDSADPAAPPAAPAAPAAAPTAPPAG